MTKLNKVHLALRTDLTAGAQPNEHLTLRFWRETTTSSVRATWDWMQELTPVYLKLVHPRPFSFISFEGEMTYAFMINKYVGDERTERLFSYAPMPHVVISKELFEFYSENPMMVDPEGLICDQVYLGMKVFGRMVYYNMEDFNEKDV